MSTLNQAFIKAYQRRGAGAPHIRLPQPEMERRPDAEKQREGGAEGSQAPAGAALSHRLSDSLSLAPSVSPTLPRSVSPSLAPAPSVSPALPLTASLRPAFEVERFDWPAIVTALFDHSQDEMTSLLSELLPAGHGTLVVSGCRRGEGRTSVALMLARHVARGGARVVLVDADLDRPRLATSLATVVEVGWEETLLNDLPAGEALIESLSDRLTILPLRRAVPDSALAAHGAGITALVERLQAEFDLVCLDTGPLIESGDARHEALFGRAQVEASVVVRDVRHCRLEQTHAVGRKLAQRGVSRWAIVENFCGAGVSPAL